MDLGFSLHYGWAIEGAIGLIFKIDASYLGPNILAAEDIVDATEIYDVKLIVSGELQDILSPFFQDILRVIDRVSIDGIDRPMFLYTTEIEEDNMYKKKDEFFFIDRTDEKQYQEIK